MNELEETEKKLRNWLEAHPLDGASHAKLADIIRQKGELLDAIQNAQLLEIE